MPLLFDWCICRKRKIPELDAVVCLVAYLESLVGQEFRIDQKGLLLCRREDAQTALPLLLIISDTFVEQVVGIAMSLETTRYPETVDIHVIVRSEEAHV